MKIRPWCVLVLVSMLGGCDGPSAPVDAGPGSDAGQDAEVARVDAEVPDAEPEIDGGGLPPDGGATDGGPMDAGVACGAGEVGLRGVCIEDCGVDPRDWEGSLAPMLVPVASFCRPAAARTARLGADTVDVWDLTSATSGTRTDLTVSRWAAIAGEAPSPTTIATHVVDPSEGVWPGSYLEVSPDGSLALFGYTVYPTTPGGPTDTFLHVATASGNASPVAAPGNFDAAWLEDGTFLLNGLGLLESAGGQGLYAGVIASGSPLRVVQVATGLGMASGGVVVGPDYVLAGGFFEGDDANRLYAIARAEIERVIAGTRPIIDVATADGTSGVHRVSALPSVVELVGDRIVVAKRDPSTFEIIGLRSYPIVSYDAASGLAIGEGMDLTLGPAFHAIHAAGTRRYLLEFAGGVLLVSI